jgi:transposase
MAKDIILTVDYHDENCVVRRRDQGTNEEVVLTIDTSPEAILGLVEDARVVTRRRRSGRVIWIQESTTGWARVQALLGERVSFLLANVVQMPLPPKSKRRKTDRLDTARMQREYLNGELPLAHQPPAWWRQVRRLVGMRENLVNRRTALRNGINRYLAHETWESRANLWSGKGQDRLRKVLAKLPSLDGSILLRKLDELDRVELDLSWTEKQLHGFYHAWPEAQKVDAVRGIGVIAAVSIVARIGPLDRFANADHLISYAGLAPGVRQSDRTRHDGHIGGGGTDKHLRHYLIEATVWARQLPRYQPTYERVARRRGKKIGRLVVARMLVRSIYKVLRDGIAFEGEKNAEPLEASAP